MCLNYDYQIKLKPITIEDAEFIFNISNNQELMNILCETTTSFEFWKETIKIWNEDTDEKDFIIIRNSDNKYIGWLAVNGLDNSDKSVWLKIICIYPEFWNCGYGSVAIKILKNILYQDGYTRLQLWTDKCNARAQKCYIENGFSVVEQKQNYVGTQKLLRDRSLRECSLVIK